MSLLSNTKLRAVRRTRTVRSHFDGFHGDAISGWVWEGELGSKRTRVGLFIDGSLVCEQIADQFRPDLKDAGIGDGHHAFRFDLAEILSSGATGSSLNDFTLRTIEARIISTNTPLDGQPLTVSLAFLLLTAAVGDYKDRLSGSIVPLEYGDV